MHSTLFTIYGLPVHAYGLMMVVGFLLGLWRASRISKKRYGVDPERVYDLALVLLVSGIIGSRIVYVLINPGEESLRDFLAIWQGGLSFHGGLIFAILAGVIYCKFARLPFLDCADLFAPSLAIGYAFTRIGCFLNGCCYGSPTNLPWGVRFLDNGVLTPPSHPTQLYAFAANMIILLLLIKLEKLHRKPGFVFVGYVGLYSTYRFLVEFLRSGYTAKLFALGLTQAQWVSLGSLIISAALLMTVYRKAALKTPAADR